jgi:heme exporter protein CcmD
MSEFLAMGGYGWYIWMAYGAVVVVVAAEVVALRMRRHAAITQARLAEPEMTTYLRQGPAGSAD